MSGTDFCHLIRQRFGPDEQPVIAYTALSDAADRVAMQQAGFDEVLLKPLDGATLDKVIEKVGAATHPRHSSLYDVTHG